MSRRRAQLISAYAAQRTNISGRANWRQLQLEFLRQVVNKFFSLSFQQINIGGEMANQVFLVVAMLAICVAVVHASSCPSSSKVLNCTPKCLQDTECSSVGGKCCPNLCNQRSCVLPNQLGNSGDSNSSPFNKNSGSSNALCGNTKCSTFEKCEMDRSTKRPKCVRT